MKKCNLYGSLSTPPPNVQTCQIGQIEAITVTALETWRSQTQTNCFKGFPHTTAHLGLPQNERNKAYKTLPKWWDPRISKIHTCALFMQAQICQRSSYLRVHRFHRCKAAELSLHLGHRHGQPFNGHSSGTSITVATAWPWQWHQRNINSQNGRVWQES
jgi:hypothetical protein